MWHNYVAIGDSYTQGYGDAVAGTRLRSWTDWLADGLRTRSDDLRYSNLGRVATSTTDLTYGQVPAALELDPDLVSITTGANDALEPGWSPDAFAAQLGSVVRPFVERGATVLTFAYPEVGDSAGQPTVWARTLRRLPQVNRVTRTVSRELGASLLDFAHDGSARDDDVVSGDLLHPNAAGYRYLGEAALGILLDLGVAS